MECRDDHSFLSSGDIIRLVRNKSNVVPNFERSVGLLQENRSNFGRKIYLRFLQLNEMTELGPIGFSNEK